MSDDTPTTDALATTVDQLCDRIEALEAAIDARDDRIEALEHTVADQRETIAELETTVDELETTVDDQAERIETVETTVNHRHERHLSFLDEVMIGDDGYLLDHHESFLDDHDSVLEFLTDCGDQIVGTAPSTSGQGGGTPSGAAERLSYETAKLRRRLHSVAEAAGVSESTASSQAANKDKLHRLLTFGPSDVVDTVYTVHERARDLLEHAREWGTTTRDKLGTRVTLTGSAVKERLGLTRDEQLTSTAVRRVFEKLQELASDSPRTVTADTGGRGANRLVIHLTDAEVEQISA
ncbi:hypothetical protein ACFQL9_13360 [Halobaculum lipolyticum]|uniref:Uncharacterized protein n=1 Tax=Halobaculum lipolyticum TaxID=3032001 RepID=A0ABD5WH27_9EURY